MMLMLRKLHTISEASVLSWKLTLLNQLFYAFTVSILSGAISYIRVSMSILQRSGRCHEDAGR